MRQSAAHLCAPHLCGQTTTRPKSICAYQLMNPLALAAHCGQPLCVELAAQQLSTQGAVLWLCLTAVCATATITDMKRYVLCATSLSLVITRRQQQSTSCLSLLAAREPAGSPRS